MSGSSLSQFNQLMSAVSDMDVMNIEKSIQSGI